MPNYLVTLAESNTVSNQTLAAKAMVIFAADEAGARRAAEGRMDGDGNTQWSDSNIATVAELVVGTVLADAGDDEAWTGYCRITGAAGQSADPLIFKADGHTKDQARGILGKVRLHISETGIVINDGGASNVDDDIYTLVGGTFTRAATFRAIGTGAITGFELVDPGEYTVLPTLTTAAFTTSGSGTGDDIDIAQADVNSYAAILAQMVTEGIGVGLTSSIDMSEIGVGTRLFTVSTIGDDIGDGTLEFEIRHNGTVETVAMSTIVHEGIAGAVLTIALAAIGWAPPRIQVFQHNPL